MCEFCVKHGEGKKWYLNIKNYSHDLLHEAGRKTFAREHITWIRDTYNRYFGILKRLPFKTPVIGPVISSVVKRLFIYKHWGQVIPIEDVEEILKFTNSITRIPCICRKLTTGKEERLCYLISIDPGKAGISGVMDLSLFGKPDLAEFETLGREKTLELFKESEKRGMIHTVWTIKMPFAAVLCNCDYATGCISMKLIKEARPITFRAEYIAEVDRELCIGCGKCVKICQFDAVEIGQGSRKAIVKASNCQGCGVCRSVCAPAAISLKDRRLDPVSANIW